MKGGGVAIGVKDSFRSKKIELTDICEINENDEIVGTEIVLNNNETLAIFSIYNRPNSVINDKFFGKVRAKYRNLILIGDLNCVNQNWYCNSNNANGLKLAQIIEQNNLYVLNNDSPTYSRGSNILDLTICSEAMLGFFDDFRVLDTEISDHYATLSSFISLDIKKCTQSAKRINWDKFRYQLDKKPEVNIVAITPESLEKAIKSLTENIKNAMVEATVTYEFKNNKSAFIIIPESVLELVRTKRKLRKIFQKSQLPEHKKILNAVSYKVSKILKKMKMNKAKGEFAALANFNQSDTKHWRLVNKLENKGKQSKESTELKVNDVKITKNNEIAEAF
ncbi:RNA-directed DNA polymerase from mobile element jockey-like, partial [Brachionus plicatilis]